MSSAAIWGHYFSRRQSSNLSSTFFSQLCRNKLERKGCDLLVGNLVGPGRGFGPGHTSIRLYSAGAPPAPFGPASKADVAEFVLNAAVERLSTT